MAKRNATQLSLGDDLWFQFNGHEKRKETLGAAYKLLLALARESLGYTALIGAPPKVQPIFVSATQRISGLQCTHGCVT